MNHYKYLAALFTLLISNPIYGATRLEDTGAMLLQLRREIPNGCSLVTELSNRGDWPENPHVVVEVTTLLQEPLPLQLRDYVTSDKLTNTKRTGEVTVLWRQGIPPKNNEVVPFSLSGRFDLPFDGKWEDSVSQSGNLSVIEDDPLLLGRGFACLINTTGDRSIPFDNIVPIPAGWGQLLHEAHQIRHASAALSSKQVMTSGEKSELLSLADHSNAIVRCMAFKKLVITQTVPPQWIEAQLIKDSDLNECAIKSLLLLNLESSMPATLFTLASNPKQSSSVLTGMALAAYCKLRSDMELHKLVLQHFANTDDSAMLSAETLNQPCVRLLVQLAELPEASLDSPDNALLRAIISSSRIKRVKTK